MQYHNSRASGNAYGTVHNNVTITAKKSTKVHKQSSNHSMEKNTLYQYKHTKGSKCLQVLTHVNGDMCQSTERK